MRVIINLNDIIFWCIFLILLLVIAIWFIIIVIKIKIDDIKKGNKKRGNKNEHTSI